MDELELKERAGRLVYQLYSNNRKTLIELFEAAFTRMADYKARAERAEAERDDLRAQLDAMHRKASNLELELEQSERQRREISDMADKMADKWTLQVEQLRARLDAARAELAALEAADGWRWQTVENWLAQGIEHLGYWLTAETSLGGGLGFSRYTAWRYWNGDGWHDLREDDTVHFVAPFPEWPAAPGDSEEARP